MSTDQVRISYDFVILGVPVGQGNLQPVPLRKGTDADGKAIWDWSRPKLMHRNEDKLLPWRQDVARVCNEVRTQACAAIIDHDIAVCLTVVFYLPRPKSLPKYLTRHTKKPDKDKLSRALGDALTNIAWMDDAQVDEAHTYKRYAGGALDPLGADGVPRTVVRIQAQEAALPKPGTLFEQQPVDEKRAPAKAAPRSRKSKQPATQDF